MSAPGWQGAGGGEWSLGRTAWRSKCHHKWFPQVLWQNLCCLVCCAEKRGKSLLFLACNRLLFMLQTKRSPLAMHLLWVLKTRSSAWLEKLKFYVATACDSCRASYPSSLMMWLRESEDVLTTISAKPYVGQGAMSQKEYMEWEAGGWVTIDHGL